MAHIHTTLRPATGRSATVDRYMNRFRTFWLYYQKRESLGGLSLSSIYALLGGQEARFSGCLALRTDLEAAAYLEVPFVRRAWRLLRLLDDTDGRHGRAVAEEAARTDEVAGTEEAAGTGEAVATGELVATGEAVATDEATDVAAVRVTGTRFPDDAGGDIVSSLSHRRREQNERSGATIPISWAATREIGMDPSTSRINLGILMTVLIAAGFLDPTRKGGLTPRATHLVRFGTIGEFYKALVIRVFNRVPWIFDDGLPGLSAIQYHGLFLTYIVCGSSGRTAMQLAELLRSIVAEVPGAPEALGPSGVAATGTIQDGSYWINDLSVVSAAIHARFLTRVGRMLGIVESDDARRFRGTCFARRVFRWQF